MTHFYQWQNRRNHVAAGYFDNPKKDTTRYHKCGVAVRTGNEVKTDGEKILGFFNLTVGKRHMNLEVWVCKGRFHRTSSSFWNRNCEMLTRRLHYIDDLIDELGRSQSNLCLVHLYNRNKCSILFRDFKPSIFVASIYFYFKRRKEQNIQRTST